ncbi:hypothetical protein BDV19DRAFT_386564 [Aspergillus venezuelensis]
MHRSLAKLLPLALLPLVRAEGTVQDLWNSPQYPDYTTNYTAGNTITISWQHALASQFQFFCEDCDITDVDLWLTGSSYTRKLESGVNVNESTSYEWTINLDDADVESSTDWTFRFLPADVAWGDNDQEISSAKFNLEPSDDDNDNDTTTTSTTTSSTSTTSTESPTSTTTTSSTTTTTPPAATETPADENDNSDSDSDGLSSGAKAGIGVGVGAGFIILAALAFLLYRRFKALPKTPGAEAGVAGSYNNINGSPPPPGDEYAQHGNGYFAPAMSKTMPMTMPMHTYTPASELHGDVAREMDAGIDAQRAPAELDGGSYPAHR